MRTQWLATYLVSLGASVYVSSTIVSIFMQLRKVLFLETLTAALTNCGWQLFQDNDADALWMKGDARVRVTDTFICFHRPHSNSHFYAEQQVGSERRLSTWTANQTEMGLEWNEPTCIAFEEMAEQVKSFATYEPPSD